jgi:general secretion pathway protein D
MFWISKLRSLAGPLTVVLLLGSFPAAPPVYAKTKKGEKLTKDGRLLEAKKDFDGALALYEQALATDPRDAAYTLLTQRARFFASQLHVDLGQKLREKGDLEGALREFTLGMQKDPSSAISIQEWKRTQEMLDRNKKPGAKSDNKSLTPQEVAVKDTDERISTLAAPPELKPGNKRIPYLKINNQPPKVLFETVGKNLGINVVFDPQFGQQAGGAGKNFNVELSNATPEAALDYVSVLTKAFWKPLNENSIFVTDDNVTKRREYTDEVAKVFYIKNATSVQEFQEIATAIRSVTDLRRVYTYNAQKMLLIRGEADSVALAEKLIRDMDKPKAEVVVDIMVMEVNSTRTRQLAATIANGTTPGINIPVGFTPRSSLAGTTTTTTGGTTTTTTSNAIGVGNIGKLNLSDFSTSLPGAYLNAVAGDSTTRILQTPQVRASDGQKVTLKIGEKVPIASGSFGSTVGAVASAGFSPVVNTQFTFTDVGIILDVTPQVHGTDEVTLKMAVEVSTIDSYKDVGGVSQPVIGQRKSETELRLREGEINILGGLTNSQDNKSVSGIPGLINIPVLNKFFGTENVSKTQQDLMIAIIPHIVRTPTYTLDNMRAISVGTDTVVKLSHRAAADAENPDVTPEVPAVIRPALPVPLAPQPAGTKPAVVPPQPPVDLDAPVVSFQPGGEVQAPLGGTLIVTLTADKMKDLLGGDTIKIRYPGALLRLNDVASGEMLMRDSQKVLLSKDIRNDAGEATISLKRTPGATGVNGPGVLLSLTFTAIGRGAGMIQFEDGGFKNSQSQPIKVETTQVGVRIP